MRACSPTITFSSALIVENSRMFWNVRATPSEVMMSGRHAGHVLAVEGDPAGGGLVEAR